MHTIKATIGREHYKTTISSSRHTLIADEPIQNQGTNLGPSPEELLMMSLASCTAITLRMYIDRKKWDIQQVEVQISLDKQNDGYTILNRTISFTDNPSETQQKRLTQIANACPVHKMLTRPMKINTNLL
jgi:putative redox protein